MSVRPYHRADARAWLALLNLLRERPLDLGSFLDRERSRVSREKPLRLVFEENSEILGIVEGVVSAYLPEDHLMTAIAVTPTARRRGIGTLLFNEFKTVALEAGIAGLACEVVENDPNVYNWARSCGLRDHVRRISSTLDLAVWSEARQTVRETALAAHGFILTTMGDGLVRSEELLPFFRDRVSEAPDMANMPRWDLELCRSILFKNPHARDDWIVVAQLNGRIAGLAVMHSLGTDAYLYFVGSAPWARGRGLGVALIGYLAGQAKAERIPILRIDNIESNSPALRINDQIGFVGQTVRVELRRTLTTP
ncbi:GNAT family N-acetyltransferase [uncultured Nitratireductor sp.]|uniref:GNAT family N-acetyltransferase n=1 Tax=uncultured Nitratireductor sp. TaxID=520953 RepID=UPI002600D42A|nr:GNAT family N-acetyltransferase [uncultured Nitratireductor sp.]